MISRKTLKLQIYFFCAYLCLLKDDNEYIKESEYILNNLNHKNPEKWHNTSRGRMFIPERFYDKYAEIQIHTNILPIEYVQEIRFTDNYLYEKKSFKSNQYRINHICNNFDSKQYKMYRKSIK